jgi:predicted aldo/keto reductase-like oxidoreductase
MSFNNRREFLKKSLLGIPAVAMLPGAIKGNICMPSSIAPELPIRMLGKTGIKAPVISFGTSGALDTGFIRAAYEGGIKLFFSATYYGEGNNEKLVGEGLKGLPRDSFVVGTAGPPDGFDGQTGTFSQPFNPDAYIKKAEGSLKRFGLDYVDFFLFPYAGKKEIVLHEGVLKALETLKKQGKTKFVGIASHSDTEEALRAAADSGVYDVAMIAYNFKIKTLESLNASIEYAVKAGMGIVAMKTTSGVLREKSGPPLNTDAILKWALQNENITSVVSGMTSFEQLQKNLAMVRDLKLTDQERKDLGIARLEPGLYCQQCRNCLPQCPHGLDIPAFMRSYMYAFGYKNLTQARHTLDDISFSGNPCETCQSCKVSCASRFDIKNKILDISRLRDVPKDLIMA